MNVIKELMIVLGISLDIFGAMECQGSLVAKIEKKQLAIFCVVLAAGQTLTLGIGELISILLCQGRIQVRENFLGQVIAAAIFLCLGIRLLFKAWQNERIVEHREEAFDMKKLFRLFARISGCTLLAGFGFGFLESNTSVLLLLTALLTILVTIIGIYTGYRLGFEHKIKAYALGGVLLLAGGIDVILRYILKVF